MTRLLDFDMERWQSTYENHVACNLSESGVHPVALNELLELGNARTLLGTPLGYGQSNGTDELRAHIAALYPGAGSENVVVTNGSAEANFVALWHLVEPSDEVVVILPSYMQSVGLIDSLRGRVRAVWLREADGWQPAPDEIEAAVNERTRMIVVTNPNNPTGAVLRDRARTAIVQAADRVGAWILADEVYTGAEIDGPETTSFWQPDARVIATGSLSKAYGLPGLRIGWTVAPAELSERMWARKDYTTISPGQLTDRLACVALHADVRPQLLARTRSFIRNGLAVLEEWLHQEGGFHYHRPAAGALLYARYELPVDSLQLAERLRREQSLLIVPGAHFEMANYLRFGFGLPPAELSAALHRFSACIGQISARNKVSAQA
ncbi:MAG: aminotransferase class I/II-fold pyridoxal phosphate-dependent enzyme [Longimicrobiales bacterium]